jgi:hypothetical protein
MHAITIKWNGFSNHDSISSDIDDEEGVNGVVLPSNGVGKVGSATRDGNVAGAETGDSKTGDRPFIVGADAGAETGDSSSTVEADAGGATGDTSSVGDCAMGADGAVALPAMVAVSVALPSIKSLSLPSRPYMFLISEYGYVVLCSNVVFDPMESGRLRFDEKRKISSGCRATFSVN